MYQIGVDIFYIGRMAKALEENNPVYFESVFTPEERLSAKEHPDVCTFFATRFALKEAAFKALCTCWTDEMEWNQIATSKMRHRTPKVVYTGAVGCAAQKIGVSRISASLSSDGGFAFASVIVEIECTEQKPGEIYK